MPLSTSSSETAAVPRTPRSNPGYGRAIAMLIVAAMAVYAGAEVAATFGLERISRIHQRIMGDARGAQALRHGGDGGRKSLLLAGNSLLLTGVNIAALRAGQGSYEPQRYVIEATNYYDWLYGLRRLFRNGMRPDSVIVCLNPSQLTTDAIRGDFSAHFLFGAEDIWPMSRDIGADLTTTSSFYAAHFSTFYAARSELRSVLMGRLAPAVPAMWKVSVASPAAVPADSDLVPRMTPRLAEFERLCRQYGARFLFLVPPTRTPGDGAAVRAGELAHVRVLRPIPNGSLGLEFYEPDGFHLNEAGATLFTRAIGENMSTGSAHVE